MSACPPTDKTQDKINEQTNKDLARIAESMGMDQKCKQMSSNDSNQYSKFKNQKDTSVDVGWTGTTVNDINNKDKTNSLRVKDKKKSSGCGQFQLNVNNIKNEMENMSCTMNKQTESSTVSTSLKMVNSLKCRGGANVMSTIDAARQLAWRDVMKARSDTRIAAIVNGVNLQMIQQMQGPDPEQPITVNVADGITQTNFGGVNVKVVNVSDVNMQTELKENYKKISSLAAENKLKQALGVNALAPNVRATLVNNTENNERNITTNITEILKESFTDTTADSINELVFDPPCKITNITQTNEVLIDVCIENLSESAIKNGIDRASEVLNKVATKSYTDQEVAGLEDLVAEFGRANESFFDAAVKDNANANAKSGSSYIVIGIIVIIIILFLLWFFLF